MPAAFCGKRLTSKNRAKGSDVALTFRTCVLYSTVSQIIEYSERGFCSFSQYLNTNVTLMRIQPPASKP
jgi:hypothetical protein